MNQYTYYIDLSTRFAEAKGKHYIANFLKQQKSVLDRCLEGEAYVLATYYIPNELFVSFDLPVLFCERIAGFGAACNMIPDEDWKNSDNYNIMCSYQLYLDEIFKRKLIPLPQLIVASDFPCKSAYNFCKGLSEKYEIPFLPLWVQRNENAETKINLTMQIKQIFEYLHTHFEIRKSMKVILNISNQMLEIKKKIDSLRYDYPGIVESQDMLNLFTLYNDFGKEESVKVLELLLEDIEGRVDNYLWKPGCKKLMWLGTTPLCLNLLTKIEEEYPVRFIYEDLFQYSTKKIYEKDLFQNMAEKIMDIIYFTEEKRVTEAVSAAQRFQINGCIHYSQRICKFLPPIFPKIQKKFEEKNIPIMELSGDGIEKIGWNNYIDKVDFILKHL